MLENVEVLFSLNICFEGGSVHFFSLSLSSTAGTGDKKFQFVLLNLLGFLSERNLLVCQHNNMMPQEYNSKLSEILQIFIFLKVKTSALLLKMLRHTAVGFGVLHHVSVYLRTVP